MSSLQDSAGPQVFLLPKLGCLSSGDSGSTQEDEMRSQARGKIPGVGRHSSQLGGTHIPWPRRSAEPALAPPCHLEYGLGSPFGATWRGEQTEGGQAASSWVSHGERWAKHFTRYVLSWFSITWQPWLRLEVYRHCQ